jgi:preprotein translocase subunit YajC
VDFFISSAQAQATGDPGAGGFNLIMLIIFIGVFWFLIFRPQMKRQKEHRSLVESLSKGDEVVTNGGVLGKITDVGEAFVTVEISGNTSVKVQKHAVAAVMPKGTIKSA